MKRSLLLTLAAGLIASLAFATPSQAGSMTVVTTTVSFSISPSSVTATNVEVTYSTVDPISDLLLGTTNLSGVTLSESANVVAVIRIISALQACQAMSYKRFFTFVQDLAEHFPLVLRSAASRLVMPTRYAERFQR